MIVMTSKELVAEERLWNYVLNMMDAGLIGDGLHNSEYSTVVYTCVDDHESVT